MIQSAVDGVNLDQLLEMLSTYDQEKQRSTIPTQDCDQPKFYWVFRNIDFQKWNSASCSHVLWLSGPPDCSIHHVSSYIIDMKKNKAQQNKHSVLYFFCSSTGSIVAFIQTLLYQYICSSPLSKRKSTIIVFLKALFKAISRREETLNREFSLFKEEDPQDEKIKKILNAPLDDLWAALEAALADEKEQELLIVVDGLDQNKYQKSEFCKGVREFVERLQERVSKVKTLLTSRPQTDIKELYDELLCVEYDKERKGSATHLNSQLSLN